MKIKAKNASHGMRLLVKLYAVIFEVMPDRISCSCFGDQEGEELYNYLQEKGLKETWVKIK